LFLFVSCTSSCRESRNTQESTVYLVRTQNTSLSSGTLLRTGVKTTLNRLNCSCRFPHIKFANRLVHLTLLQDRFAVLGKQMPHLGPQGIRSIDCLGRNEIEIQQALLAETRICCKAARLAKILGRGLNRLRRRKAESPILRRWLQFLDCELKQGAGLGCTRSFLSFNLPKTTSQP
jgi:hypothetical protein